MESKVSVVMPCYNAAEYISQAIESVINQTYSQWELIIVDDASSDESLRIIEEYAQKDSRIKVYVHQENKGVGAARNTAIRHCTGSYIAFLDADDVAKPQRLNKQVHFLRQNTKYGAVGGQAKLVDKDNHIIGELKYPLSWNEIKRSFLFENPFMNSSMMFRKCILDKYHISFDEGINMGEDFLFWINVSKHCRMCNLSDCLIFYRDNMSGLSHKWSAEVYANEEYSKAQGYVWDLLWKQWRINVDLCDKERLVNALYCRDIRNVFEMIWSTGNIIKYGLAITKCRYDKIVFQEMEKSIKKLYVNWRKQVRRYKRQFQEMRNCVCEYGDYPRLKYMVLDDKKLIYLEMPKVANCAIKAGMLKEQFKDDYSVQGESLKYTVHELERRYESYYKFTFVRNPLERVVSCYESKYHKDKQMLGSAGRSLEYNQYLFGYIRKDKGFTNFLCRIALIPDSYKDHHFKPQYRIVYDKNGKQRVNYIGKYENLNQEYQSICQTYDLNELSVYNKTERANYMDYYNRFTARIAGFIYRKDIKYFGYTNEYKELVKYVKRKKNE